MITYKTGNLLDAPVQALVNTVNTVGVLGKGIALQFKNNFPENTKAYLQAVKDGSLQLGTVQVVPVNTIGPVQYIINFPTKGHWRYPSRLEWIKNGLADLRAKIIQNHIQSIALPPLGCGNGGLNWQEVKPLIEAALADLPVEVLVYEPSAAVLEVLAKEDRPGAARLTAPRAMLLQLLYRYRALGEYTSEFAAEKLCYFLQRFGETQLKLHFQKGIYGPYSGKVRHVLYALNGYYIKGYEQKDAKPFAPLQLMVEKAPEVQQWLHNNLDAAAQKRLDNTTALMEGFETPYGLELLATVDYLAVEHKTLDAAVLTAQLWSDRKKALFPEAHVAMAVQHLGQYREGLYGF
jgi:O-acetyl-ADP-ribose deacetylase (regulator of RNase III)